MNVSKTPRASSVIHNFLYVLHSAHLDNASRWYFSRKHRPVDTRSEMPVISFIYEWFIYNALYQHDWEQTLSQKRLVRSSGSEREQQKKFEEFLRQRTQDRVDLIKRAFKPLVFLEDLHGPWTQITVDERITAPKRGEEFFENLETLRDILRGEIAWKADMFWESVDRCRAFVYDVRCNIFHGRKSPEEILDIQQKRRIEIYDLFLKCLVSLFFLVFNEGPVGVDVLEFPVDIPIRNDKCLHLDRWQVGELLQRGAIRPGDTRLINLFFLLAKGAQESQRRLLPPESTLFYPSAGQDIVTPLLLGLPFCKEFLFYDVKLWKDEERVKNLTKIRHWLHMLFGEDVVDGEKEGADVYRFVINYNSKDRFVYLIGQDNLEFLQRDVRLGFYFHRGDSYGEGGSGQLWDSKYLGELGKKVPSGHACAIVTDGEPGGVREDVRRRLRVFRYPFGSGQIYFGIVRGEILRGAV